MEMNLDSIIVRGQGQECQCVEESDFLAGNTVGVPMDKRPRYVH